MFIAAPIIGLWRRSKHRRAKKRVYGVVLPAEMIGPVSASLATVRKCHVINATPHADESDIEAIVRLKTTRNQATDLFRQDKILFIGTSRVVIGRLTHAERIFTFVNAVAPIPTTSAGGAVAGAGAPNSQVIEAIRAAEDGTGVYAATSTVQVISDILEAVKLNRML